MMSACDTKPGFPMADWAAKRRAQIKRRNRLIESGRMCGIQRIFRLAAIRCAGGRTRSREAQQVDGQ